MVEHLPSKSDALSSNPNNTKKKKRTQTTSVGEDVGRKEPSYTAGGNVN
jgi:hypothetical protein